jgi:hypothetical protein
MSGGGFYYGAMLDTMARFQHRIDQHAPPWAQLVGRCRLRESDVLEPNGSFYVLDLTPEGRTATPLFDTTGGEDYVVVGRPEVIAALRRLMPGLTDNEVAAVVVDQSRTKRLESMFARPAPGSLF